MVSTTLLWKLTILESIRIIEASSSIPIDDFWLHQVKIMMQFMDQQSNRSIALDEKSENVELVHYLCEPGIDYLHDKLLQWLHKRGSNKYPRIQCSQRSC